MQRVLHIYEFRVQSLGLVDSTLVALNPKPKTLKP